MSADNDAWDDADLTTGMMSGSDEGDPGELAGAKADLTESERALLEELQRPGTPVVEPVEESEAAQRAITDEAPLKEP